LHPHAGIDKEGVSDIRVLLLELKNQGKTIILASHSAEEFRGIRNILNIICRNTAYILDIRSECILDNYAATVHNKSGGVISCILQS
jgi:ABC-type Mn2+/Zn2+ transport system ATPase subunit